MTSTGLLSKEMARAFEQYRARLEDLQEHLLNLPDEPTCDQLNETTRRQFEVEKARSEFEAAKSQHRKVFLRSEPDAGDKGA